MRLPTVVYHLAEDVNWPLMSAGGGLHCATDLLRRSGLSDAEQQRLGRMQRTEHTVLPSGVALRDQKPMPARALRSCLIGMTPPQWYTLINSKIFFWLDPDRLNRQRGACEPRPQVVLTIDVPTLVSDHADSVSLSPINSGNARRRPAPRSVASFVPVVDWLSSGWECEVAALGRAPRPRSHAPVELTVDEPIPDVHRYVRAVTSLGSGESFRPS